MEIFYHLGHFFEILTGIYFGGFALLSQIEKGAKSDFFDKVKLRQSQAASSQILTVEYFKVKIGTPNDNIIKFILLGLLWIVYAIFNFLFKILFWIANIEIRRVAGHGRRNMLEKNIFLRSFLLHAFALQ